MRPTALARISIFVLVSLLANGAVAWSPASPAPPAAPSSAASPRSAAACLIAQAAADPGLTALSLEGSFCAEPDVFIGLSDGSLVEALVLDSGPTFIDIELPPDFQPVTSKVLVTCGEDACAMDVAVRPTWTFLDGDASLWVPGNVGLGTDTPQEKLSVGGNLHASGTIRSGNSVTIDGAAHTIVSDGPTLSLGGDPAFSSIKVGVATTSPNETLTVAGKVESTTGGFKFPDATVQTTAADLTDHESRLDAIEALLSCFSLVDRDASGTNGPLGDGRETLLVTGCNVQVVNGTGTTAGTPNGLGNVIVGYNENSVGATRTGSHVLVVGQTHEYTRFGGIVSGNSNTISGDWSSVTGGFGNKATGEGASVTGGAGGGLASGVASWVGGGAGNEASGDFSSVSGGQLNTASNRGASVSGGEDNVASGLISSISGGSDHRASGNGSSVSGGQLNAASGASSWVGGGQRNEARASLSAVGGGQQNTASGTSSSVTGGLSNSASGHYSSVSGGFANSASGHYSSVSGGEFNKARGDYSSVSGGQQNAASGDFSSVSGGQQNAASGDFSSVSGGGVNEASGSYSSVTSGERNTASGHYSSVSAGAENEASSFYSSVSGGWQGTASGSKSSVSGGFGNTASGQSSTVSGGGNGSVSGANDWRAGTLFEDT